MSNTIKLPSQDELYRIFDVDFDTGTLYWKEREDKSSEFNKKYAGKVAGCLDKDSGYVRVGVDGTKFRAHRIIYAMYHVDCSTEKQIDHINGVRDDNRIENLRLVDHAQNTRNVVLSKKNKVGVSGIWYNKARNKYEVTVGGKATDTGQRKRFSDFFEACCYRKSLENMLGYHPNHGRMQ